jgi:hypothetical protein
MLDSRDVTAQTKSRLFSYQSSPGGQEKKGVNGCLMKTKVLYRRGAICVERDTAGWRVKFSLDGKVS